MFIHILQTIWRYSNLALQKSIINNTHKPYVHIDMCRVSRSAHANMRAINTHKNLSFTNVTTALYLYAANKYSGLTAGYEG